MTETTAAPREVERVMTDRALLYTNAFLRAFGTGLIAVVLGFYLSLLRLSPATIGYVVAAGLTGAALACLAATMLADRWGRRRSLMVVSALGVIGAAGVALSSHPWLVGCAAFVGMLNGMGRDRGAALILDQAILPTVTTDRERTKTFAVYNVIQDLGHALGSLTAGLPAVLESTRGVSPEDQLRSYQLALAGYAAVMLVSAVVYGRLSPSAEPPMPAGRGHVSPATRRMLWRIASLFAVDSLGGGFLTTALLTYFFFERFAAPAWVVAALFFVSRLANAVSHLGAAWLAGRIGLLNTMVFTHIPSSLLLVTVAFAPNFPVAAILFVLRESLVEMDVPTRQSYIMAIVRPEERTVASGVTNLVRMAAWAVAPALAGLCMEHSSLVAPLFIGASLKIGYDVALYRAFRGIKPPEESQPLARS
jgi:MFS family permease